MLTILKTVFRNNVCRNINFEENIYFELKLIFIKYLDCYAVLIYILKGVMGCKLGGDSDGPSCFVAIK